MSSVHYTNGQLKAIVFAPCITSSLSFLGSSAIVLKILSSRRKKLQRTYHRILLCMSCIDAICSIGTGLSIFPAPRDTPDVPSALGNTATCDAQGFIYQFSLAVPFYNGMLSLHYLLSIRYGMHERSIRRKAEPFMHSISLLIPLSTAIAALTLKLYNFDINKCWIAPYPYNCTYKKDVECTRGINAQTYRNFFYGIWILSSLICIPLCMAVVYYTVRSHEKKMQRYNHTRLFSITSSISSNRPTSDSTNNRSNAFKRARAVANQGTCYVLAFVMTFLFSVIARTKEDQNGKLPFHFFLLAQILFPMQGFFNFLIYFRTDAIRIRGENPDVSWIGAFGEAICPNWRRRVSKVHQRTKQKFVRTLTKSMIPSVAIDDASCCNDDAPVITAPDDALTNKRSKFATGSRTVSWSLNLRNSIDSNLSEVSDGKLDSVDDKLPHTVDDYEDQEKNDNESTSQEEIIASSPQPLNDDYHKTNQCGHQQQNSTSRQNNDNKTIDIDCNNGPNTNQKHETIENEIKCTNNESPVCNDKQNHEHHQSCINKSTSKCKHMNHIDNLDVCFSSVKTNKSY